MRKPLTFMAIFAMLLLSIDLQSASAFGWERSKWERSKSRTARVYGYGPAYGYGGVVYGYGPVYASPSIENRTAPISGYGPGYAPGFGAGYYTPSVKTGPNGWIEPRGSRYR